MKHRREKALQNAKDRKLAKGNPLAALQADQRANRASNDIQSSANLHDELIDGSNTNTIIGVENTDNTAIAAENVDNTATDTENTDNDATNADNTDNAAINADNTSNAATDSEKSDDAAMSDDNTANTAMSDNVPSPLPYGRKTKDPSKVKTSKRHTPIMVEPSEPSTGDPSPDEIATAMASGHAFDPTDMRIYEFLFKQTKPTGLRRYRGGSITRDTTKYPR